MNKLRPELWRSGGTYVEGFINPTHSLVYLANKETAGEYGMIILSVEQMAEIIVAHQKRLREYLKEKIGGSL